MSKPIKFKEFQKSRNRFTRQQFEKESGLEVHSPEIYAYVNFLHIEIHQIEEVGEMPYQLYVVHTQDSFETANLEEAERNLYEAMKEDLPKRKSKKEKEFSTRVLVDISQSIGLYSSSDWDCELLNEVTDEHKHKLAIDLADLFEKTFNGNEYHETMSYFVMNTFKPKKKEVKTIDPVKYPNGLNSWLETHYQIIEFMGANQGHWENCKQIVKGSEVFEEIDGQCGKQEFAENLTTEFETKMKNEEFDWDETDFFDELDKFLKDAFYPKKKFKVKAKMSIDYELDVEAYSIEEAKKIAYKNQKTFNKLEGSEDWEIIETVED